MSWYKKAQNLGDFEHEKINFKEVGARASEMSEDELRFALDDLNKTIKLQEESRKAGFNTPKLGYYYDERHIYQAELNKRKKNTPIEDEINKMPLDAKNLYMFAKKYPGVHSYKKDVPTKQAIQWLLKRKYIGLNEFDQFFCITHHFK